jgi:hypothetical protein
VFRRTSLKNAIILGGAGSVGAWIYPGLVSWVSAYRSVASSSSQGTVWRELYRLVIAHNAPAGLTLEIMLALNLLLFAAPLGLAIFFAAFYREVAKGRAGLRRIASAVAAALVLVAFWSRAALGAREMAALRLQEGAFSSAFDSQAIRLSLITSLAFLAAWFCVLALFAASRSPFLHRALRWAAHALWIAIAAQAVLFAAATLAGPATAAGSGSGAAAFGLLAQIAVRAAGWALVMIFLAVLLRESRSALAYYSQAPGAARLQ